MSKFKVGDKVRVINNPKNILSNLSGKILTITDNIADSRGIISAKCNWSDCNRWSECDLELIEEQTLLTNTIITGIKDAEQHKRVQEKLFEMGCWWSDTGKEIDYYACKWNNVYIFNDKHLEYISNELDPAKWYRDREYKIDKEIPASEFLGEEEKDPYYPEPMTGYKLEYLNKLNNPSTEHCVGKGNKIMSLITNALKSKEDKALEHFNLGSEKELNSNGQEEFIQHLYQTLTVERKSFLAKIVEAYKEDKNK